MSERHRDAAHEGIRLSICMATFKRGKFIGETLDCILAQMVPGIELVVVDGASPDNTPEVMAGYVARFPALRYIREAENSGVDRDYDKAVEYASGEYCWLMTDDDLLVPGAIPRLVAELDGINDLVIVNEEVRSADFSRLLTPSRFKQASDRRYGPEDAESFFIDMAQGLSFIGCVVIKRDLWLARDRASYYSSLFIHAGVIFQRPAITRASFIAAPLIVIRYGNAMWTARSFEIWMFMWPQMLWAFSEFSESARAQVTPREPWRDFRQLLVYRASGGYALAQYRRFLAARTRGIFKLKCLAIALCPAKLMNILAALFFYRHQAVFQAEIYSLAVSEKATWVSRLVGRKVGVLN